MRLVGCRPIGDRPALSGEWRPTRPAKPIDSLAESGSSELVSRPESDALLAVRCLGGPDGHGPRVAAWCDNLGETIQLSRFAREPLWEFFKIRNRQTLSGGLWWSQYIISVFVPTYLLLLILYREFSHWGTHTPFQKVVPENVKKLGN